MEPPKQTVVVAAPYGKPAVGNFFTPNLTDDGPTFLERMQSLASGGEATEQETPEPEPAPQAAESKPEAPAAKAETKPAATVEATAKDGLDALLEDDAPAEPEAAKEEPADPADEVPKGLSQKATIKWGELKAKAKLADTLEQKVAALEAQVKERAKLADADPLKKEFAAKEARLAELEKKAQIWSLEDTQHFQEAVTKPKQAIASEAVDLAKRNEVEPAQLITALTETDGKRQKELLGSIAEGLDEQEKWEMYDIARRTRAIFAKEDELRANAETAAAEAKALESQTAEKTRTETRAAEMHEVANVIESVQKIAAQFALEGEDAAKVMEAIAAGAQETPFSDWDLKDKAFAAFAAKGLPKMQRVLKAAQAKIAALEKEVAGMAGAAPSASGSSYNPTSEKPPEMSFLEALGIGR